MLVQGYLAGYGPDQQGIVEASKCVRNKGFLVAKSIVNTENQCQLVSILNFDENLVKLKRYDVLATVGDKFQKLIMIIHCVEKNLVHYRNI